MMAAQTMTITPAETTGGGHDGQSHIGDVVAWMTKDRITIDMGVEIGMEGRTVIGITMMTGVRVRGLLMRTTTAGVPWRLVRDLRILSHLGRMSRRVQRQKAWLLLGHPTRRLHVQAPCNQPQCRSRNHKLVAVA